VKGSRKRTARGSAIRKPMAIKKAKRRKKDSGLRLAKVKEKRNLTDSMMGFPKMMEITMD
jgi:hypothetical protein